MNSATPATDIFVGCIAIALGLAALGAAVSGGRWVAWSGLAQGLEQIGGRWAVIFVYAALGLFMMGVGISLLR